ncbi:sugar phosphate isomerase/epimerase family protein [Aquabacter sp. P-9]|uniref:sugar phosphate isomerase/epimerase family protein n=1 Tax=Aquabacter sediminis TaxID=3029197 RepID=UPI00237D83D4|nr:sugar phosphate isomerase/epimerase [Aquabacter sp. P-9]MDE1570506.1 sugar phosphate isomerase/epimerase [Aquabacter sp. P-9]
MVATVQNAGIRGIGYSIRATSPDFDDLTGKLDEAERLGVDFVELPLFAWTMIAGGRVIPERLDKLQRCLEGRPFGYTVHGHLAINLMEVPSQLPAHERLLAAAIEVAGAVRAANLVIHTGCVRDHDDYVRVAYVRQREALQKAGDLAAPHGVTVCVENVFEFETMRETASPSRLAEEIDAIAHPFVRATLDVSHAFIRCTQGRLDFLPEIAALAPFARHVHVHDSFGTPSRAWAIDDAERLALGEGDLHLPIGWGSIPWETIAQTCRLDAGAILNLELHRRYWSELPLQVAAMRALEARFRGAQADAA